MRFFLNFPRKGTEKQQHNNIFMESARHVCLSVCRFFCENEKTLSGGNKVLVEGRITNFPPQCHILFVFNDFLFFFYFFFYLFKFFEDTLLRISLLWIMEELEGEGLCLWLWPLLLVTSDTWGDQLKYKLLPNSFKHIILAPNSSK